METTDTTMPTVPIEAAPVPPGPPATRACPRCGEAAAPSEAYCEQCGAVLPPTAVPPGAAPPEAGAPAFDPRDLFDQPDDAATVPVGAACPECGGMSLVAGGFCGTCGLRVVPGTPDDHTEVDLGVLAAVRDRGLVHAGNEDAMGLALVPWSGPGASGPDGRAMIAVVCDGVSTTPGSGPAADAAARAATAALSRFFTSAPPDADPQLPGMPDIAGALRGATRAALAAMPASDGHSQPASCTFVAAVVTGAWLTVGWLGDSRAYLLTADGGAVRLTADDTLSAEAARAGRIPAAAAESARGAHTITRWLSADAPDPVPRVAALPLTTPGRVVLCSDGLWNYASGAADVAAHVAAMPAGASALSVARRLVSVALRAGGRDNITVAVMDIAGSA